MSSCSVGRDTIYTLVISYACRLKHWSIQSVSYKAVILCSSPIRTICSRHSNWLKRECKLCLVIIKHLSHHTNGWWETGLINIVASSVIIFVCLVQIIPFVCSTYKLSQSCTVTYNSWCSFNWVWSCRYYVYHSKGFGYDSHKASSIRCYSSEVSTWDDLICSASKSVYDWSFLWGSVVWFLILARVGSYSDG